MDTSYRSRWRCAGAAIFAATSTRKPLTANQPEPWQIPLRDHDHAFLKGHRLMVQVQSTWFPVIDRNPQKFVPSIYQAKATDYVPATQRIFCTPGMPSHLVLPVIAIAASSST